MFYGSNDWHYYLSQGLPLLLTTYLPFALIGLWKATSLNEGDGQRLPTIAASIRTQLVFMILSMIATLSLITHKEVRFIYPLLPLLHIIAAPRILDFFSVTAAPRAVFVKTSPSTEPALSLSPSIWKRVLLVTLLCTNLGVAFYTTQYHQRGVLDVLAFLKSDYEDLHLNQRGTPLYLESPTDAPAQNETFAAFLMPCHSTPWRSRLVYPTLRAWALTCEPPLHIPATLPSSNIPNPERKKYLDEADRFYADPVGFLRTEVNDREQLREWPRYVVGFEGIGPALKEYYEEEMRGWTVREKWRGFNSHWHDDWRRRGDVVVWEFVETST